jgi:hypothetical protein
LYEVTSHGGRSMAWRRSHGCHLPRTTASSRPSYTSSLMPPWLGKGPVAGRRRWDMSICWEYSSTCHPRNCPKKCTDDEGVDVLLRDLGAQNPKVHWKSLHSPSQEGVWVLCVRFSNKYDPKVDIAYKLIEFGWPSQCFYWMYELLAPVCTKIVFITAQSHISASSHTAPASHV